MNHDTTTRTEFDVIVAISDAQHALEHIPSFIIPAVQMHWRNQARRVELTSGILPLGDDEVGCRRT
jgi:hypothetical protein